MQLEFWEQRWQQNQTGFHLNEINPYLREHWHSVTNGSTGQVFVPLCGKSLDLLWLQQQHHRVIGVECSELAVNAFFKEQAIDYETDNDAGFTVYHSDGLSIYQGDYFQLDAADLKDVSLVYDRAALVAMPEQMRKAYVDTMIRLLPPSVSIMLVALEYNQSLMSGPPFSVTEDEIRELYGAHFNIEKIHQFDIIQQQGRFRDRGLDSMIESVYKLTSI